MQLSSSTAFIFFFSSMVHADKVYLKDGSVINGEIVEETKEYVKVRIGSEGSYMETVIRRREILRIEYTDDEEEQEEEKDDTNLEKGIEAAKDAIEKYDEKDYDAFLRSLSYMMRYVFTEPDFKKAYLLIEEHLDKKMPEILEDEMERQCNQVVHVKPFYRLCPTCKGERRVTRYKDGKKKEVRCPTCGGKGRIFCKTCKKRIELAENYRKKVRYTDEEMKHIVYLRFYYKGVSERVADRLLKRATGKFDTFTLDEDEGEVKVEISLGAKTIEDYENMLAEEGINYTRSAITR
ncbi:MAG: hypothetical protein U5N86_11490 [Planctomycetota bacterium]|nr:hypothetical protein [Planctomycetota bacterium]